MQRVRRRLRGQCLSCLIPYCRLWTVGHPSSYVKFSLLHHGEATGPEASSSWNKNLFEFCKGQMSLEGSGAVSVGTGWWGAALQQCEGGFIVRAERAVRGMFRGQLTVRRGGTLPCPPGTAGASPGHVWPAPGLCEGTLEPKGPQVVQIPIDLSRPTKSWRRGDWASQTIPK